MHEYLTDDEIEAQKARAKQEKEEANVKLRRLNKTSWQRSTRARTQRLVVLGAMVEDIATKNPDAKITLSLKSYALKFVTRESDKNALRGSVFEIFLK